jgi:hypothetical protein
MFDDITTPTAVASGRATGAALFRRWGVAAAGLAVALATFLPWASISAPLAGNISVTASDVEYGTYVIVASILATLVGAVAADRFDRAVMIIPLGAFFFTGVFAVVKYLDARAIGTGIDDVVHISPGIGMMLCAISSALGFIATLVVIKEG